jgi:hypothetical protein
VPVGRDDDHGDDVLGVIETEVPVGLGWIALSAADMSRKPESTALIANVRALSYPFIRSLGIGERSIGDAQMSLSILLTSKTPAVVHRSCRNRYAYPSRVPSDTSSGLSPSNSNSHCPAVPSRFIRHASVLLASWSRTVRVTPVFETYPTCQSCPSPAAVSCSTTFENA